MLGKEVNRNDKIGHEKFTDLVSRGVLIHSFDGSSDAFIPTVPELFLHKWLVKQGDDILSNEIRGYLDDILRMRSNFTGRNKFETMHFYWEIFMRHVRQSEPLIYDSIRLNDLYCNTLRYDATFASSRCVDGCTFLRESQYVKDTMITLDLNTVYNPQLKQNKENKNEGWDRLIVMEAFLDVNRDSKKKEKGRFIIPVFIKIEFSDNDADEGSGNEDDDDEDGAEELLSIYSAAYADVDVIKAHEHFHFFLKI